MSIKKKVTFKVPYDSNKDVLSTQLNDLLQQIASLIISQNSGLTIIDTITFGSSRMTDAPLYDTRPSNLNAEFFEGHHYESDVIFIGTSEDNVCLSINFFDGELVIAMNMSPKVEQLYADSWSKYALSKYLAFYAVGKASRSLNASFLSSNLYAYTLPYSIIDDEISFSIVYWNTKYSSGYSFINGSGQHDFTDLVIYPTEEGDNKKGIGGVLWTWGRISKNKSQNRPCILAWSFSENLAKHMPSVIAVNNYTLAPTEEQKAICNAQYDIRQWFNAEITTIITV